MGCFMKYCKCNPAKRRISRKMKKQLVSFLKRPLNMYMKQHDWIDLTSCDMRENYKHFKPLFTISKNNDEMIDSFFKMLKDTEWQSEGIYIDRNGRLSWYWELDDDFTGGTSGLMPFCYSKEEAGNTWAYSEMHDIFHYLTKGRTSRMPESIKSDFDLLIYFKKNPTPFQWVDEISEEK